MGYVRDMVMSWAFGTGLAADAFYVAYRIPNLLRELLAEGLHVRGVHPGLHRDAHQGIKGKRPPSGECGFRAAPRDPCWS